MPINWDDNGQADEKQQIIGVIVLVVIVGLLLFLVLKASKRKK